MAATPEQRRRQQQAAFRTRLAEAMRAKGLIQRDLATRLGVAESTITGWLRYGALPDAEVLFDIPEALGISLDWLLTGRGDQKPAKDGTGPDAEYLRGARAALSDVEVEFGKVLEELGLRWNEAEVGARRRAAATLAHERKTADDARATPGRRGKARRAAS